MKKLLIFLLLIITSIDSYAQSESTKIVVRAIAKDAKFIGTSMDGAHIKITDVESGEVLAEGNTQGSTGNTDKLVREPWKRYGMLSSEGAAKFEANLNLTEPVFAEITASGPNSPEQARVSSSTQLWLLPGKDITGDGIILEIPGFAVDINEPASKTVKVNQSITVTANVVMMCGCPITPGGLWNSEEMEFTMVVERGDRQVAQKTMTYAGQPSTFQSTYRIPESGSYNVTVYVFDPRTGNTGLDSISISAR